MGFMDKAKKLVEQAQQEAKDGTLKARAKGLADQAQHKLDEVQGQFNDRQQGKGSTAEPPTSSVAPPAAGTPPTAPPTAGTPPTAAPTDGTPPAAATPDTPGTPPAAAAPTPPATAPIADVTSPIADPATATPGVDRSHEAPPKVTGGDPLAG
jgi:hypothetical protein